MPSIHDQVSEQFYRWEPRARGWKVFDTPVTPEPPFEPFRGYHLAPVIDDGVRPSFLASLFSPKRSLGPPVIPQSEVEPEPEPNELVREDPLIELQTTLPANLSIPRDSFEAFLSNARACSQPLAFELVGTDERITSQFVCDPHDGPLLRRQLIAHFPEATFLPTDRSLAAFEGSDEYSAIVEFGLHREFLYQIATGKIDPFISIVGALSELKAGESGIYQVLFEPCRNPWSEAILKYVSDTRGHTSFFANRPEFASLAEKKLSKPLYGVVLRIAAKSDTFENSWEILRNLAGALSIFAHPNGNELVPLQNDEYRFEDHLEDLLKRQSRRSGMLLNADELLGLVHMASPDVRSTRFRRQATNTKAAPQIATQSAGLVLGLNQHAGETRVVRLNADQRTSHMHVIGASGTGKSTFLFSCIKQDIEAGEGLAVLDPHGDLIDRILGVIPSERIKDVILVDPSDETASIPFNILSAHSDLEKTLLASDLVSVFQRLSQTWGDQMEGVLRNAVLAFLESSKGGTLSELRRFLLDSKFRQEFLKTVADPDIRFYWEKGFVQLSGNKSIGSVLTRLEMFLAAKPLRNMVAQQKNNLDFGEILDSGKIFLAKLSQGAIGKQNAYLLGSLLMAKFQQTAMARQRLAAGIRRDFWIYLDEFHNFITPSLAEILSGARKYRIGLVLAHQELRQLERDREVSSAVLSNPYARVVFRVGDSDARALESGFSGFAARDLQNLGTGEAIVRVERSDFDFNITVPAPEEIPSEVGALRRNEVITASRQAYCTPRSVIEQELRAQYTQEAEATPERPAKGARKEENRPAPVEEAPPVLTPPPLPAEIPVKPSHPEKAEAVQEPAKAPADLGRGGEQHKAIQKRVKEAAERLGFLATTEKAILDNSGSVDVALESANHRIAVEITVTTTIDHEVGNVLKCLKAGFPQVAVISSSETKLQRMKEAVPAALGPQQASRIGYFLPDTFLEHLRELNRADQNEASSCSSQSQAVRRGYKVKCSGAKLSATELQLQEAAALRLLAETLRKKRLCNTLFSQLSNLTSPDIWETL